MKQIFIFFAFFIVLHAKAQEKGRVPNNLIVDIEVKEDDLRNGSNLDCILFFTDGSQSKEFNVNHGEGINSRHFKSFTVPCTRECLSGDTIPKVISRL